jgi:hypothetical protein
MRAHRGNTLKSGAACPTRAPSHTGLMRSRLRWAGLLTLAGGALAGCPSQFPPQPNIRIEGTVLDEVGNLVWPTLVTLTLANGELTPCATMMGRFSCDAGPWGVDTLRLERGSDVYTEQIGLAIEDCQDRCLLDRPFVVAVGPEGACSTDALPLVARLTSSTPLEVGMISGLQVLAPEGLNAVVYPADLVEPDAGSEAPGPRELLLYVDGTLSPEATLLLEVTWQQSGSLCGERVHGSESHYGTIEVELQPRPGPLPCSYVPAEIRVGPEDVTCR